jgi:hypothetical protein
MAKVLEATELEIKRRAKVKTEPLFGFSGAHNTFVLGSDLIVSKRAQIVDVDKCLYIIACKNGNYYIGSSLVGLVSRFDVSKHKTFTQNGSVNFDMFQTILELDNSSPLENSQIEGLEAKLQYIIAEKCGHSFNAVAKCGGVGFSCSSFNLVNSIVDFLLIPDVNKNFKRLSDIDTADLTNIIIARARRR